MGQIARLRSRISKRLYVAGVLYPDALDVGSGNQPLVHHFLDHWKQALDVFGGIDDGDHDRLIAPDPVRAVNFGRLAVAFKTAENRCAGDFQLPAFLDNSLVERLAVKPVALRKMEAQELGGMRSPHGVLVRS